MLVFYHALLKRTASGMSSDMNGDQLSGYRLLPGEVVRAIKILLLRSELPQLRIAEWYGTEISGLSYRHRRDAYDT